MEHQDAVYFFGSQPRPGWSARQAVRVALAVRLDSPEQLEAVLAFVETQPSTNPLQPERVERLLRRLRPRLRHDGWEEVERAAATDLDLRRAIRRAHQLVTRATSTRQLSQG